MRDYSIGTSITLLERFAFFTVPRGKRKNNDEGEPQGRGDSKGARKDLPPASHCKKGHSMIVLEEGFERDKVQTSPSERIGAHSVSDIKEKLCPL